MFTQSLKNLVILFPAAILSILNSQAQPAYTQKDSAYIYSLMNKADALTGQSLYDSAKKITTQALVLSSEKKFLRGEAASNLKIADLISRQGDNRRLGYYDSIALKLAMQIKDSFLVALAYYQLGVYFMNDHDYDQAMDLYNKSLFVRFEKDQSGYTATVYNDIGYLYGLKGELDKQISWYLKAIDIYGKIKDAAGLAQTVSNLSVASLELGKKQEAVQYAKQAITIREKLNDKSALSLSYNNISQIYLQLDSVDQAIRYQQLGLRYAEQSESKMRVAQSYTSLSLLLNRQKKNAEALECEKKAIAILEAIGEKDMLSRRYIAAGILSKAISDSIGAIEYFQKAYDLSFAIHNKYNLRDLFLNRAIFYKDRKDFYNAYENYKKYIVYRDSIINEETNTKIADIQTKYETEKKDNEIISLNADQKIRQLEIEKQKAVIAGNVLEAKQKQNEIDLLSKENELRDVTIRQQDEELEKQFLLAKTNEQELKLAQQEKKINERQLQSQKMLRNIMIAGIILLALLGFFVFNRFQLKKKLEQQKALLDIRNNIARDLHDEIGSTLTSIKILSEVSGFNLQKDRQKASALMQKITEQSSEMQQGMSDIVWAIRPDNDKLENMAVRMREYVSHTLEPRNFKTNFVVDEDALTKSIGMQQRRDFFLIFKEAINNAAKYSKGDEVDIHLSTVKGKVRLLIADNGVGFNVNNFSSSSGLKNMKARAEALKGNISITSVAGKGTTIYIEIPAT
jgi:two-component system sensor histidine kinase UhpB